MTYCDSHCHLDFEAFDRDRQLVIERALKNRVEILINSGIDLISSQNGIRLAQTYAGVIFAGIGFHPNDGSGFTPESISTLRELAKEPGVVAIGEIGLDYHHHLTAKASQWQMFTLQLELAAELDLPVIIHNREASVDIFPILKNWWQGLRDGLHIKTHPGVMHSYLEGSKLAEDLGEFGFMFGVGGPVTFVNGQERRNVVSSLPLKSILLETDAPFLTPQAHRGSRNEPAYIPLIAQQVAECLRVEEEQVACVTTQNVKALFRV